MSDKEIIINALCADIRAKEKLIVIYEREIAEYKEIIEELKERIKNG
jgi:hypothetical protein